MHLRLAAPLTAAALVAASMIGLGVHTAADTAADTAAAAPIHPRRHPPAVAGSRASGSAQAVGGRAEILVERGRPDQVVDGFGGSTAFAPAGQIRALPAAERSAVLSLLFSSTRGAGLDILRIGLDGPPGLHSFSDQIWVAKAAERFGVRTFWADSWSAPAAMKSNDSLDDGGSLCGLPGVSCSRSGARQAYARYLAHKVEILERAGIPIAAVDPVNEPELVHPYPSMLMTPAQAANFLPFLAKALRADHLGTTIACCDADGWPDGLAYSQALLADPAAARVLGLVTSHGYGGAPTYPLTLARPVWESEWATFQPFDAAWNDGSDASGLAWAENIETALSAGRVNGFLYWWLASTSDSNQELIELAPTGPVVSGRFWAIAGFSRFVRPGAVRVSTVVTGSGIQAVAFREPGRLVVVAVNSTAAPVPVALVLAGPGRPPTRIATYSTDAAGALVPGSLEPKGRAITTVLPAASEVSLVLTPGSAVRPGRAGSPGSPSA